MDIWILIIPHKADRKESQTINNYGIKLQMVVVQQAND